MLRLDFAQEPHWLDLGHGVRLRLQPRTTALMAAARSDSQVEALEGVGLRPFSVAHVEQPWRRTQSPGELTVRWTRRALRAGPIQWKIWCAEGRLPIRPLLTRAGSDRRPQRRARERTKTKTET